MDANEIDIRKLRLQEQELELKQLQLALDFAKFGFRGTLAAGIGGLVLIFGLSALSAFRPEFQFGTNGVIFTALFLLLGTILFGAYSLRQPIKVLARLGNLHLDVNATGANRAGGVRD